MLPSTVGAASSMKSGLVANIFALDALDALDALRRAGLEPAATVHLQSVVEEESTGNGALAVLVRGYRADAALISEPTGHKLVRAALGVIWFQVKLRGHPVHVSNAGAGANAIEAAYHAITALRGLEADWNARKSRFARYAGHHHPINLNVGKIAGGDWASSVPAWCTVDFRIALYPGVKPKEMAREIEACVRRAAATHPFLGNNLPEVVWNGFFTEGFELGEGSDAEQVLAGAHASVLGAPLSDTIGAAYIDTRVFALYAGVPALTYGARMENAHGFDERASLSSLRDATKTITLFVARWCGLRDIEA